MQQPHLTSKLMLNAQIHEGKRKSLLFQYNFLLYPFQAWLPNRSNLMISDDIVDPFPLATLQMLHSGHQFFL